MFFIGLLKGFQRKIITIKTKCRAGYGKRKTKGRDTSEKQMRKAHT